MSLHDAFARAVTDAGAPIGAGWQVVREILLGPNTTPLQEAAARRLFYLGAQHLFATIVAVMDAEREPTPDDLRRMDLVNQELERFLVAERSAGPLQL